MIRDTVKYSENLVTRDDRIAFVSSLRSLLSTQLAELRLRPRSTNLHLSFMTSFIIKSQVDRPPHSWKKYSNCAFCRIINNESPSNRVYENDKVVAFLGHFVTSYMGNLDRKADILLS